MDDRRKFLKVVSAAGAAVSAFLAGVPPLRAFLSPLGVHKRSAPWVRLGEAEQFEFGVPTKVEFPQTEQDAWVETRALRSVWVYTDDAETFQVYAGRCTHLACSYGFDEARDLFHCPCHNGLYDVKTGEVLGGPPPRPLDTLQTKVEDGYLYAQFEVFRPGIPQKVVT